RPSLSRARLSGPSPWLSRPRECGQRGVEGPVVVGGDEHDGPPHLAGREAPRRRGEDAERPPLPGRGALGGEASRERLAELLQVGRAVPGRAPREKALASDVPHAEPVPSPARGGGVGALAKK